MNDPLWKKLKTSVDSPIKKRSYEININVKIYSPMAPLKFPRLPISFCNIYFLFISSAIRRRSNDHGRTRKCNFSVLDRKYLFWAYLVHKIKIASLSWNLVTWLMRTCRTGGVHFLCFRPEIPFWTNLVRKFKIVSLSWNFVTWLIRMCRIQSWCSLFPFRPGIPFLGKFDPKNQNY